MTLMFWEVKKKSPGRWLCCGIWKFQLIREKRTRVRGTECRACFIQFSSVTQLCLTLCDPMDCFTPGFPVHHQLLELTQTHVHPVSDAI